MFLNVSLMKVHVILIMISCATRITLIHIASVIGTKNRKEWTGNLRLKMQVLS